jgi:hypothetical protein
MTTKIVCRLLDANNALLGWTVVMAEARGDGHLWTSGPVVVQPSRAGTVVMLSLHWADVNVESRIPMLLSVRAGQGVVIYQTMTPFIKVGNMPGPLPPVTVGSVSIGIPAGGLGTSGVQM